MGHMRLAGLLGLMLSFAIHAATQRLPLRPMLTFEGADDFVEAMRAHYTEVMTLKPERCSGALSLVANDSVCSATGASKVYLRGQSGALYDSWYGGGLPAAADSCDFAVRTFPQNRAFTEWALAQQVYVHNQHFVAQCTSSKHYNVTNGRACHNNNFKVLYGTEEQCVRHAINYQPKSERPTAGCFGKRCAWSAALKDMWLPMIAMGLLPQLQKKVTAQSPEALRALQLPPPPFLSYTKNAVVEKGIVTTGTCEMLATSCTPYWQAVLGGQVPHQYKLPDGTGFLPSRRPKEEHELAAQNRTDAARAIKTVGVGHRGEITASLPADFGKPYAKVFVVNQVFSDQIFHYWSEVVPRLGPFLDKLVADKEIMTYLKGHTPTHQCAPFQLAMLELLGIDRNRCVSKKVAAAEVFIPQRGQSHNPYMNFWHIIATRQHIEKRMGTTARLAAAGETKMILLIHRGPKKGDPGGGNGRSDGDWLLGTFQADLEGLLPGYKTVLMSSSNQTLMECLSCQVKLFMRADVVIGSHGAGLTLMMYAPRGATLISPTTKGSMVYQEICFMLGQKFLASNPKAKPAELAERIGYGASI